MPHRKPPVVDEIQPYPTSAGVETAIKEAAKKAAAADSSLDTNERIRLEYFNRFLSRIFSEGDDSEWVLKGGTGMLARVPSGRPTRDVDLYRKGYTLDEALDDLRRLAAIDLGDHFVFQYIGRETSIGGEEQPYTEGYAVSFDILIGGRSKNILNVDLSIGAGLTAPVTITEPANALDLPRLIRHEYRVYPVVDQIADKVCATMQTYRDRPSSREKDLVDLVVLAVTQNVDGTALGFAIASEARRRQMEPFEHFTVPSTWGTRYAKLSKSVPYCADYRTVDLARELVTRLIDPALTGEGEDRTWRHDTRSWS
ncbi:Nucleotidyl transferase AbiEii toxin, Type IV TA system [Nocardioides psychrotolerans]|uniref:Nucleotidyl transferase AbiEii toxin, Type IV TA system n=1 Tax=Nocardioides psychrotolerans TaxID=1005945 RepID=A0A1I3NV90_9ACTN|nr:Nucleotidyl transferase AbiEii toxin, Type IV TA system [Nocardioides psychrotolerans]